MATAETHGIVNVYNTNNLSQSLFEMKDHFFPVNDIQFTWNQPWMATCGNDTLLNMHDLNKGQLVRTFMGGHQSFISRCKFNAQENLLLSVGADGYLFIYDIRQNKMIQKIFAHPEPLTGVDISTDSSLVCTSAYDGYVRLWDFHRSSCVKTLITETGSTSAVSCL